MDKKILKDEYKKREITGGVYRLINTRNGSYLLGYAIDLQARENRFNFQVASNSCPNPKLKSDWQMFGGQAYIFEVLETIAKKEAQTDNEFVDDLMMLEELWSEKLGSSNRY